MQFHWELCHFGRISIFGFWGIWMAGITSLFVTGFRNLWGNMLVTILNIGLITFSGSVLYFIILQEGSKYKGSKYVPSKKVKYTIAGISTGAILLICMLYLWSTHEPDASSAQSGWDYFCRLLLMLLDPILSIRTLAVSPVSRFNLTGINLLARVLLIWLLALVVRKAFEFAWGSDKQFGRFLEEKIYPSSESGKAAAHTGSPSTDGSSEAVRIDTKLVEALAKILSGTGIVGGFFAYILGGDSTRESIEDVLTAIKGLLDTITLTAQVPSAAPGMTAFFSNFLYIALSICVLAIYGVMFATLFTFIAAAWNKRNIIMDWITKKGPVIFLCCGVAVLIFLACAIVFLTGSSFGSLKDAFLDMFQSGAVFDTVARFVLLVLSICISVLMLGFIIVFTLFIIFLGFQIGRRIHGKLKYSSNIVTYAQILAVAIISAGVLLGIGYGYNSLANGLLLLFPYTQLGDNTSLLWVTGHILLLVLVVPGTLLAAVTLIRLAVSTLEWILSKRTMRAISKLLSPIRTLMQIFVGYSTESEKNRAVFLAAAFASLASLLNTFFGLMDFYYDRTNAIPVICSLAIAMAVQLAMLIFGMKAGEGIAERVMLGFAPQKRGRLWTAALKTCIIFSCISGWIAMLCVVWTNLPWGDNSLVSVNTVLLISLVVLSGVIFSAAIFRQILDLVAMWKDWKAERKVQAEGTGVRSAGQIDTGRRPLRGFKRLPPYFYLTAYLSLIIVSTGFAFNNLFGYYASQANLHEQVFEQVIDQADRKLQPHQRTAALVSQYEQNTSRIISILDERAMTAAQKLKNDMALLDQNITNQPAGYDKTRAQNLRDSHYGNTRDFLNIVEALKNYITADASSIGTDASITVYKYSHFWGPNAQPSYETTCIEIVAGEQTNTVGQKINLVEKSEVTYVVNGETRTIRLVGRFEDSDQDSQSITEMRQIQNHVDKYAIIETLLNLIDTQENEITKYNAEDTIKNGGTNPDSDSENTGRSQASIEMRQLLAQNDTLDSTCDNLAEICLLDDKPEQISSVTIRDLPHLVVSYLQRDKTDTGDKTKLEAYHAMSNYIDRMLEIYDILAIADTVQTVPVNSQMDDGEALIVANALPTGNLIGKNSDMSEDSSAYSVRTFRNYAQGIANSNFQISCDTLFRGNFGLNPTKEVDALYRSNAIAKFILLICFLVDMMAFFSGLLLFKEVFLFKWNSKLAEIGYLNYDALLTAMFTPPCGDPIRLLHLALIYRLLYGDPDLVHADLPDNMTCMKKLHDILNSKDFQTLYDETVTLLEQMGIREGEMPALQQWLMDFVQKNGIDFDEQFF